MLHLKDLYCTKIVHISRVLRGVDGHRREPGISCNCTQKLLYQRSTGSSRGISLGCVVVICRLSEWGLAKAWLVLTLQFSVLQRPAGSGPAFFL